MAFIKTTMEGFIKTTMAGFYQDKHGEFCQDKYGGLVESFNIIIQMYINMIFLKQFSQFLLVTKYCIYIYIYICFILTL